MKKEFPYLLFIYCLWLLTACSTSKITIYPQNSPARLTEFQTFDFYEVEASGDTSANFNDAISLLKSTIAAELNNRGLTQQAGQPDLKINLGVMVEEKTQTRETSLSDPGEWTYMGQRNYKWESRTVEVGTYKEGSVTVDLVNNTSNELVWEGVMQGVVPRKQEKRQEALTKAVASLFDKIDQRSQDGTD